MNTTACESGTVQFTFFLVIRFSFITVMYYGLYNVIIVSCFSSVKLGIRLSGSTPKTLYKIKYGSVKLVVIFIAFYPYSGKQRLQCLMPFTLR